MIFDRIQIEACRLLHWRELDERLGHLSYDLLNKHEAPELVGDPVVVRLRLVRAISALHRIEAQVCEDREVRFNSAAKPATRLIDKAILVVTNSDRPKRTFSKVDDLFSLRRSFPGNEIKLIVAVEVYFKVLGKIRAFERVTSIVTLATPHRGTPLASLFGSAMGQPLLRWLARSAIVGLEHGKLPLSSLLRVGSLVARVDDLLGFERTLFDQLYAQLFEHFDDERRRALIAFLDQVSKDRALIVQLTPDSLDLFNATTADPAGIAYGSVVTRARRPSLRGALKHHVDPYAHALHFLFSLLWLVSSRSDERYLPSLSEAQRAALLAGFGALPELADNDGMVPTLSQVWGEIVHVAEADHLDVMGQYGDLDRDGVHADWLPSQSGFNGPHFAAMFRDVVAFITRDALRAQARPASAAR